METLGQEKAPSKTVATVLLFFIKVFSGLMALVGLGIIVGTCYLWKQGGFNQFIALLLLLGVVIVGGLTLAIVRIQEDRTCVILLLFVFNIIVTAFYLVFGSICAFDSNLVEHLSSIIKDSEKAVADFKEALDKIKTPFMIIFLTVSVIGILNIILIHKLRSQSAAIEEHDKKEFAEGDDVLRSIKGGKNKREKLYDTDSVSLY